jgi:hypothetical protein
MESFDDFAGARHAEMMLRRPGLERLALLLTFVFVFGLSKHRVASLALGLLHALARLQVEGWESAEISVRAAFMEREPSAAEKSAGLRASEGTLLFLMIEFFQEAAARGFADESVLLLDELKLGDKWRPLREALVAFAGRDEMRLNRLGVEVRSSALEILASLRLGSEVKKKIDAEY